MAALLASVLSVFSILMLIDCVRSKRDTYWFWIIFASGGLGSIIYYFYFHWNGSPVENFIWHTLVDRRKVTELRRRILVANLPENHVELGDAYTRLSKFPEAEASYRAALEKDSECFDATYALGCALLIQERPDEAWPFLKKAYTERPHHDQDELLWQCARCQTARGHFLKPGNYMTIS